MTAIHKIRRDNDVNMALRLTIDGVPVDFDTLDDIQVYVYSERRRIVAGTCSWEAAGTTLKAKSAASQQRILGPHRVILTCTLSGSKATYDALAFDVVATSEEVDAQRLTAQQETAAIGIDLVLDEIDSSLLHGILHEALEAADAARQAGYEAKAAATTATAAADLAESKANKADKAADRADAAVAEFPKIKADIEGLKTTDADHDRKIGELQSADRTFSAQLEDFNRRMEVLLSSQFFKNNQVGYLYLDLAVIG